METPWIASLVLQQKQAAKFFLIMYAFWRCWFRHSSGGDTITGNIPKLNICGPIPCPANFKIHLKTLGRLVLTAVSKAAMKLHIISLWYK